MPMEHAHTCCNQPLGPSRDTNQRWLKLWSNGFLKRLGALVAAALMILPIIFIISSRPIWIPSIDRIHGFLSGAAVGRGKAPEEVSVASTNSHHDKLLGGLLSAEFNEESCLSRYHLASYRKISPHLPSPYLLQRLRQYEALHKKCGPSTDLYNRSVDQLKSGNGMLNATNECNYVIWLYCSGLGNRILTLASAFLYALLTNRVLLIENNADMKDLFCEAFPGSSWILPSDFPLFPFTGYNVQFPQSYGNMLGNNLISNGSLPTSVYLHLAHDYTDMDKRFFCDEDQSILRRIPWLVLLSNNYFTPSFFEMPAFNDELNLLFPKKDGVFHHLGRYLFHPTNHVWGLITRYYDRYLSEANERLGIQIRVFDKSDSPIIGDQILKCTLKENLLPGIDNNGQVVRRTTKNATRSKAVLLTSLSSKYYDMLQDMYWEGETTMNGEIVRVYQPSHEQTQKIGDSMHEKKALAEMYLLSMTDELVTSARSTFGYVAQGLGGMKPWILFKLENQRVPDPPCRKGDSIEPCFHAPPYYDCKAKRVDYSKLGNTHLMPCEDLSSGIKLTEHIK